ncbi:PQQ-binding-like beta-propeller repeat protein [Isosphaeraceae bacterium EP7]
MIRRLALAWVAVALTAPTLRAQQPLSRDLLPTHTSLNRAGLERQWNTSVPLGHAFETVLAVSLSSNTETVYGTVTNANLDIDPVTDEGSVPSTTQFIADGELSSLDDVYVGSRLVITSGPMKGTSRRIIGYNGTTKTFRLGSGLPASPQQGTAFTLFESLVYVQTNEANFYAYDAESGRLLWSTNLTPNKALGLKIAKAMPVSANSRAVFVSNANTLFALDRGTGKTLWTQELPSLPSGSTAATEDIVTVGLTSGRMMGYALKDMKPRKSGPGRGRGAGTLGGTAADALAQAAVDEAEFRAAPYLEHPVPIWSWQSDSALTAPALPAGEVVSFGSGDGRVFTVLAKQPLLLYRFATGGPIVAQMGALGTRTLVVPSMDHNLYAIDLFTGERKWLFPTGSPIDHPVLISAREIFVQNTGGELSSVHPDTGEAEWTTSTFGGDIVAVSGAKLYLRTHDGDLLVLDRATGKITQDARSTRQRAGLDLRSFKLTMTNTINDRIYLASPSGSLICLREIDQVEPKSLRDPAEKPFGYIPPEGIEDPFNARAVVPATEAPTPDPATTEAPAPDPAAEAPEPKG